MKKFTLLVSAVFLLCSCGGHTETQVEIAATEQTTALQTTATAVITEVTTTEIVTEATTPEPEFASVNIVCAGDNLIHSPLYDQAKCRTDDRSYNFMPAYENVAELISEADLAILNQETIISDNYEPTNFPYFCSPTDLAHDMIELGFDAISVSNNHCLDKGEEGLISTLDFWREAYPDIPVYGAYRNEEDMNNIRVKEINGITFAFLGYMEHTNGLYLSADSECKLTYMYEEELVEEQVKRAAEIADCVIVSVHFGVEVSNTVTHQQYVFSQELADWGADIIIGTQPHTIQTMEYLTREDGGQSFVFYCLGNFISVMDRASSMVEMLGRITVTKNLKTGEISLSDANAVPLINHYDYGYQNVRIYPFSEYTEALASKHGCAGVSYRYFEQLIKENIPEEFISEQ